LRETSEENRKSLLGVLVLMGTSIASWQLLSMYGLHSTLSAPLDAFKMAYRLLLGDGIPPPLDNVLWGDIGVSLAEIFGGLVLGGGVALVVYKSSFAGNFWRKRLVLVLPLTYITPIMISPFLLGWGILTGASQTTIGVALLSFFPFIQVLWGLPDCPLACRILAAADEALPPAFVAMLFGETMHAFSGLGFFMLTVRDHTHRATEAVATLLIIIALLIGLSAIFRTIIKRLYQEPLHT
jgi:ABC-type nitrate/sulfonate/bicarbonate transport system permease component